MSGESYNNAYSVLENRRLAMRAKYFAKQDEINNKVPMVAEITNEINHLGASYTLAVLAKIKPKPTSCAVKWTGWTMKEQNC